MRKTTETEEERQLAADKLTIRRGVTKEALEVLERRYGYNLPIFGADAMYSADSNDKFLRQALIKEGQRQVISFLRFLTNTDNNG